MNVLAIDYGQKRVGFAYSINGIISPLPSLKNDKYLVDNIKKIISDYSIRSVYVGISQGRFGPQTKEFYLHLKNMLKLPIEAVEETASTKEADQIFVTNKNKKKNYNQKIDSISACVILSRARGY